VRIVLIVLALAAGGWLFLEERAVRAQTQLTRIGFEGKGDPARAPALLATARRLNPDRRPDLFEGVVLARQNKIPQAIAAIRKATTAEPENLEAWALLASVAQRSDPKTAAEARAHTRALAPPLK
jgi:predicted Zn-dependent protease